MSQLSSIVGKDYFWMDIFCVDQRNKADRVAITQYIPTIFRHAQRTIVIRDGGGFRDCCVQRLGSQDTWFDIANRKIVFRERIKAHHESVHKGEEFYESVLSRLWVFQEIIVSNNIQFVRCEDVPTTRHDIQLPAFNIELLCRRLYFLAQSWESYGKPSPLEDPTNLTISFLHAFFYCNSTSRSDFPKIPPTLPTANNFRALMKSTHRTTKPRDFILATMPQYVFYTVPHNAKEMSFLELFRDCCVQLEVETMTEPAFVGRKVFRRRIFSSSIEDVPEPIFLGDLAKIFYGQKLAFREGSRGALPFRRFRGFEVDVRDTNNLTTVEILRYIRQSMRDSESLWTEATNYGDLVEFTRDRVAATSEFDRNTLGQSAEERLVRSEVCRLVEELWSIHALLSTPDTLDPAREPSFNSVEWQSLLHLTALISCGLAVSSFKFSTQHRIPILVDVGSRSYLTVVDRGPYFANCKFSLAKVDSDWPGTEYVLAMPVDNGGPGRGWLVYPFPPHVAFGQIKVEPEYSRKSHSKTKKTGTHKSTGLVIRDPSMWSAESVHAPRVGEAPLVNVLASLSRN